MTLCFQFILIFVKAVELIPIFDDNYVFLITNSDTSEAVVVDPGEASAVSRVLQARNLRLSAILTTHHHNDHIGGVAELVKAHKVPVWAPLKNRSQIIADHYLAENDTVQVAGCTAKVIELPGHTLGHIAYWFADENWLFSGDVLFGLGCGRLFEGDFAQGFESLQKIKKLPGKTLVYCAHEYTEKNLLFCKTQDYPGREQLSAYETQLKMKRNAQIPSVPLLLETEKHTNPFLLASTKEEFATLRTRRNVF